jgi:hypothetical protein
MLRFCLNPVDALIGDPLVLARVFSPRSQQQRARAVVLLILCAHRFGSSDLSIFPRDIIVVLAKKIWQSCEEYARDLLDQRTALCFDASLLELGSQFSCVVISCFSNWSDKVTSSMSSSGQNLHLEFLARQIALKMPAAVKKRR